MTKTELKKLLEIYGDDFYCITPTNLQLKCLKTILNCKRLDDFTKISLIDQYTTNLITNNIVIEYYSK